MNLIFDIGGNRGLFTDECLKKYPESKIILVEPNNKLNEFLIKKYKNKNVVILDYLISTNSNEEINFFVNDVDTISTASTDWINFSRFSKKFRWNPPIKKKTINLDDLIKIYGNPNIIKIDVEGYEYEVIKGLSKKQSKICFEWCEEEYIKVKKISQYLINLGYENFGVIYGDEYMKEPNTYTTWENCSIHSEIDVNRKDKWGMIWVH